MKLGAACPGRCREGGRSPDKGTVNLADRRGRWEDRWSWPLKRRTRGTGTRWRSSAIASGSTTRFALSLRDISEMMLERGVVVSHETVRQWCAKFGQGYANQLRRRRPRLAVTGHCHPDRVTSGIWTRCSSGLTVSTITSGAPSAKTATYSMP